MIKSVKRLSASSIPYTTKQISKMEKSDKLSYKNLVQRGYVWERKRRSELIWSVIMNYPIPPIYCARDTRSDKKLDVLDGKQRIKSLSMFINDEYSLSEGLEPIPYIDENDNEQVIDISGKKFSELDEELRDLITDRTLVFYYYDDMTQAERAEMFRRLNNGKPLSTKSRTLASCRDIEAIINIGNHKLFEEMLSEKAIENKNQVPLIMKIYCMLKQDIKDVSFESKIFNPLIENTVVSNEDKLEMAQIFDYIVEVHSAILERGKKGIAKKLYTETHLVSMIPMLKKSLEDDIEETLMADWIIDFFSEMPIEYKDACSGSAKPASIQTRNEILICSYNTYFEISDFPNEEDEEFDEDEKEENKEDDVNNNVVESDTKEVFEEEEQSVSSLVDEILDNISNNVVEEE